MAIDLVGAFDFIPSMSLIEMLGFAGAVVAVVAGLVAIGGLGWRLCSHHHLGAMQALKEKNEASEERRLAAEEKCLALEREKADLVSQFDSQKTELQAQFDKKQAELQARLDELQAENQRLSARLGVREWTPPPPGPFDMPHISDF